MSIVYPLPPADFWERLRISGRPEFMLQQNRKQSTDGGGNQLTAFFGMPKWTITVALAGGRHNRNLEQEADLKHLDGRDGTFLAYDTRRPYPASDPDGVTLGAAVVKVRTKGSNNRSLSLEDLTGGYVLTKGDKGSILYDGTKRHLFELMESVTADGSGDTAEFEIQPPLPVGVDVGDVVTLIKPCAKFKLVAGSYRASSSAGNMASGPGFSAISVP